MFYGGLHDHIISFKFPQTIKEAFMLLRQVYLKVCSLLPFSCETSQLHLKKKFYSLNVFAEIARENTKITM